MRDPSFLRCMPDSFFQCRRVPSFIFEVVEARGRQCFSRFFFALFEGFILRMCKGSITTRCGAVGQARQKSPWWRGIPWRPSPPPSFWKEPTRPLQNATSYCSHRQRGLGYLKKPRRRCRQATTRLPGGTWSVMERPAASWPWLPASCPFRAPATPPLSQKGPLPCMCGHPSLEGPF